MTESEKYEMMKADLQWASADLYKIMGDVRSGRMVDAHEKLTTLAKRLDQYRYIDERHWKNFLDRL